MSWRGAYRAFSQTMKPFVRFILVRRIATGKEDPTRVAERRGIASLPRPDGPLIWMHGASVGETSMLLPLIERMLADDPTRHILVTSGTMTSAKIMAERLPDRAFHQMMPLDVPDFVEAFLQHWQPDLAVWAESDMWPNLVLQTEASGAKMALINARMSQKSIDGWRSKRGFARDVFGSFDVILPADRLTHNALSFLAGDNVVAQIGNLKSAAPAPEFNADEVKKLRENIGDRPIWLVASTHPPEEQIILDAHIAIRANQPDALLIWVPRHPERGDAIAKLCEDQKARRRSIGERPDAETSIYIMDTLGEMGLALALSDVVFVGGSLDASLTGHNPLEPARAGVAILTGPHIASFTDIYARFDQANAVMRVRKPKALAASILALLDDGAARGQMVARARVAAQENDGILDATVDALEALL